MEVCLPADFYKLRDELPVDWPAHDHPWSPRHLDSCPARDASARDSVLDHAHPSEPHDADAANRCADPDWRVF